jgi:outer membrane protein assembly factor BamB
MFPMNTLKSHGAFVVMAAFYWLFCFQLMASDWPMWRYDAQRSAASPTPLAEKLSVSWRIDLPGQRPAWPEDPRLMFDATYQPIVADGNMYVASSANDSVVAFDTETGQVNWRFFADGPVRFAPIAWQGRIYFGADDGALYCLDGTSGRLLWRTPLSLGPRRVIGNERLISVWPVRGGPVRIEGAIYCTTGIWPFEGTFLHAVDAQSGAPAPIASGSSERVKMLSQLSPQGYLAAAANQLYLPCGRAKATSVDLASGALSSPQYGGRPNFHLAASESWLFHAGEIYDSDLKKALPVKAERPVSVGETIYYIDQQDIAAMDLGHFETEEAKDRRGETIQKRVYSKKWQYGFREIFSHYHPMVVESLTGDTPTIDIKAGHRLYGHIGPVIFALDLAEGAEAPRLSWSTIIEGKVANMIAADGKLFVSDLEGSIYALAPESEITPTAPTVALPKATPATVSATVWSDDVTGLLKSLKARDGYALVLGIGSGRLIDQLVAQSKYHIIAVDPDEDKIAALRTRLEERGLYGDRVVAQTGDPLDLSFPPYLANLITSEDLSSSGWRKPEAFVSQMFATLRPYGGVAVFEMSDSDQRLLQRTKTEQSLSNSQIERFGKLSTLSRVGALAGAADWSYEYGDPSNTLMSRDQLVKAPLGALWFGGPSSDGRLYFDRHRWGPSMIVKEGRMFIQGPETLTAIDVYTGRLLWQSPIPKGRSAGRRGLWGETGYHFIAEDQALYLIKENRCHRLDPASGKEQFVYELPEQGTQWGRIRIWGNLMIIPVFRELEGKGFLPVELMAMDRVNGEVVWRLESEQSFPMVSVGGGKVFCFEGMLEDFYRTRNRRGLDPEAAPERRVKAFDVYSGQPLWDQTTDRIVTWIAYSQEQDVVVLANKGSVAARGGDDGRLLWEKGAEGKGFAGHPESLWNKVIIWKDRIIDQRGPGLAYDLKTGESIMMSHPITGESLPWEFTKSGHHCNYAVSSEHLLTFRAADAGYLDLETGGTGRLSGFRPGCRNSLIPANGVLNAPNFAYGCNCNYSIFTSLALVHLPEANQWTYSALPKMDTKKRYDLNLMSVAALADLVDAGKSLVIVALVGTDIHIRIFDVEGQKVVDKPEAELVSGQELTYLKELLNENPFPDESGLSQEMRREVIEKATSISGHTPKKRVVRRVGVNFGAPGDRMDPDGTLWLDYPSVGGSSPDIDITIEPANPKWFENHSRSLEGDGIKWVAASGVEGLSSCALNLGEGDARPYKVRLVFLAPPEDRPSERVFSVALQGNEVLTNFDVVQEAGGPNRWISREFSRISVEKELVVSFESRKGQTLICGIEAIAQQ